MKKIFLTISLIACALLTQAQNIFNAQTTTLLKTYFATTTNWTADSQSRATYDSSTGTLQFCIAKDKHAQWQAQAHLQTTGITLDANQVYSLHCHMHSNNAVSNITIKMWDDVALSERSAHVIQAGDNDVNNGRFTGGNGGNGVIVFDFGFAHAGDTITITNITLEEVQPEDIPEAGEAGEDGYALVWSEEFTDGGNFDLNAWNIETTANPANNELQYYSERGVSIEADPVEGKQCLVLTARKEDMGGRHCTSGRVTTQGKTTFLYGKIEGRIWFPNTANGLWPAFWMMGDDINSVGWPACGETDIVELGNNGGYNGTQDRYFNGASHWGPRWDQHYQSYRTITNNFSVEDGFHIWTCIWDSTHVAMYVDKDAHPGAQPYYEMSILPSTNDKDAGKYFHKRNFILLNLAIGGDFTGIHDVNKVTALANGERKMYIDWIHVYQKEGQVNLISGSESDEEEMATAIQQNENELTATKQIRNGKLVIVRKNTIFDILGNRL